MYVQDTFFNIMVNIQNYPKSMDPLHFFGFKRPGAQPNNYHIFIKLSPVASHTDWSSYAVTTFSAYFSSQMEQHPVFVRMEFSFNKFDEITYIIPNSLSYWNFFLYVFKSRQYINIYLTYLFKKFDWQRKKNVISSFFNIKV